jgi:sn-glycerol 3-phosphate transport system permease protein
MSGTTGTAIAGRLARGTTLALVALAWVAPYAWMTLTSLKTLPEIVEAPAYPLPRAFQLGAYREVFEQVPVVRYLATTVAMATAIALLQIALALPAG